MATVGDVSQAAAVQSEPREVERKLTQESQEADRAEQKLQQQDSDTRSAQRAAALEESGKSTISVA